MMHAHIYFKNNSRKIVERIRNYLLSSGWCIFIGPLSENIVGPHPLPQLEVHFVNEELMKAVRSFILVRENLSVFVHTVSQNDFLDHTENCFWLGTELKLDFSKLDQEGENNAIKRFSYNEAR